MGEHWPDSIVNFFTKRGVRMSYAMRIESAAFERGRIAGKDEAALETQFGPFSAHVQAVFREARKLREALEGDKLVDGLGAALSAYDDFMRKAK